MANTKHDNWSKSGVNGNFQTGCENNCRYCYAHTMGEEKKWAKKLESWDKPKIRVDDVRKGHRAYDVQVMCFSSHDITENNVDSAIKVIQKLLDKGNRIVIVSKPRLAVIERLCKEFQEFKKSIVFRFTITTTNQKLLTFWERNASSYEERKACLKYIKKDGWKTSVAVEPILDIEDADNLVGELLPYVNHSLWFGLMSKIDANVEGNSPEIEVAKDKIKSEQTDERVRELVTKHYLDDLIFWKNNILEKLGWETPPQSAMDIEHVPKQLKWLRWLAANRIAAPNIGIDRVTGSQRVLVVAPHAFERDGKRGADDEMTGYLARLLSEKYGFYALINHSYKKTEKPNKKNNLVNCRSVEQVQKHLQDEFWQPFLAMIEEIKLKYGPPIIIHVHGIKDSHIVKEVKDKTASVLIGIGPQYGSEGKPVYSGKNPVTNRLIKIIKNLGVASEKANKTSDYRGGLKDNINQYFRLTNSTDKSVQSFQLEIKKTGCRDNVENIERLTRVLGTALLKITEAEKQNLPVLTPEVLTTETEQHADEELINEAYNTLSNIFSKHFENAMLEAGEYLIQSFYNNDYELARNKKPTKSKSLRQLIIHLEAEPGAPKKSWFYNAVKLAVDHRDLDGFHTYGNLRLSHKVALLPVGDTEQKKTLIEQTVKEELTVRKLKERVASLNNRPDKPVTPQTAQRPLTQVVDKPDVLFSEEFKPSLELDDLSRKHIGTLNKLTAQVGMKLVEIDGEMKKLRDVSEKYKGLLQTIASAKAKKVEKTGTVPGEMLLRMISVSRRTDIPAFYGDWFMNRLDQGFVGIKNPNGPGKKLLSLRPSDVDCFIFWSKNYAPFLDNLKTIKSLGYNCYFHFTITGYPFTGVKPLL